MSSFCPQCGVDNPANARFCDQCGAALIPVSAPTQPVPIATPAATPAAPMAPTPAAPAVSAASGSVVCPQCGAAAIPGEAFCDNCGAPLNAPSRPVASAPVTPVSAPPYNAGVPPQPNYPPPQPSSFGNPTPPPQPAYTPPAPAYAPPPAPAYVPPAYSPPRTALAPARLTVASSGAALPLPNGTQAIVGRADQVSNFFPDVDLNPYNALDNGVGRRHARLFVQGGQVMLEDLDSTNGTTLNGQKLSARQPQPLRDGDQILIGKLLLRYSEL
jgi:hypothetical protein